MQRRRSEARARRGSATLVALVAVVVLAGVSMAMLALTSSAERETRRAADDVRALLVAEAGIAHALRELARAEGQRIAEGGSLEGSLARARVGSHADPLRLGGAGYWTEAQDAGIGFYRLLSTGESEGRRRRVEVVARRDGNPVYENALFAGNSSGDPEYTLELSGAGLQADQIHGDVYSGGSVRVRQEARVHGLVRATSTVEGAEVGVEGLVLPIPDLARMDYARTADVDVAARFADGSASWASNAAGGRAWQLPASDPAHIFRKNPNDRSGENSSTVKDDFYLEDPYETVRSDSREDGSDAYRISIGGSGGSRVYYVDGNLWLHNTKTHSFKITPPAGEGVRVTFAVRGNIYFSDSLYLEDPDRDGVAFIALKDPAVEDSGNIYFGDTMFGTLREMHAFMYAENDFVDHGLDAAGSKHVRVRGNMTAGNHVRIQRDFGNAHSRLVVELDPRIADGSLTLPGLPSADGGGDLRFQVVSWREVAAD